MSLFRSFFAAPVRFDAERSAVVFEACWLAAPVAGANAYIHELLDEARFLAARNLLQSSQAPIAEIAARLGYRDATAFTRAFRRWAGTSPIQWRRTQTTI